VPNVTQVQKSCWMHPMELLGDVGHVETLFSLFVALLALVQDRCTVCAKRIGGLEIILDARNGTARRRGSW
jgi:hypothetical protein